MPQKCGKIKLACKIATKVWQNRTLHLKLPQKIEVRKGTGEV
jgi:hypothetical protein